MPRRDDGAARGPAGDVGALDHDREGRGTNEDALINEAPARRPRGRGRLSSGRDAGRDRDHRVDHGPGRSPRAQLARGIQGQGGQAPDRDLFHLDVGRYPTSSEGLSALAQRPDNASVWNGPYLKTGAVPTDPWGHLYVYRAPAERGPYEIVSLGSDGQEGGAGTATDLSSESTVASRQ